MSFSLSYFFLGDIWSENINIIINNWYVLTYIILLRCTYYIISWSDINVDTEIHCRKEICNVTCCLNFTVNVNTWFYGTFRDCKYETPDISVTFQAPWSQVPKYRKFRNNRYTIKFIKLQVVRSIAYIPLKRYTRIVIRNRLHRNRTPD